MSQADFFMKRSIFVKVVRLTAWLALGLSWTPDPPYIQG